MWKWMGLFLSKNYCLRCWSWLFHLNWIGALTFLLLLKVPPRKMEPWYVLFGHSYLELLDKLQKLISRTVGPSLTTSLEPLAHCWNVASLSFFYRYYFVKYSSELAQLVPLPFSRGRSTCYPDRWHDFSVTISRCYKNVYFNSFFPCTARPWKSLPLECFPLTYDLNGFKSRINRHHLTVGSF